MPRRDDPGRARRSPSARLVALLAALVAGACGDGGTGVDEQVASIRITPPSATLQVDATVQLQALLLDGDGATVTGVPVTWESSRPDVATVTVTGLVTGVGPGTTTVSATAGGAEDQATITVVPPPDLEVLTDALPEAVEGSAYEAGLEASGGMPPYTWSRVSGSLPPGLSLESDGAVAGTPEEPGEWAFSVEVTSQDAQAAVAELVLTVLPSLTITTEALPPAEVGTAYSARLRAAGGRTPYTWAHLSGEMPQGLELAADGMVSGTPTRVGSYSFSVRVASDDGQVAEGGVEVTVGGDPLPPEITTSTLPDGTAGEPYSVALEAMGGSGELRWSLESGALPDGLELADVGTILGVPEGPDTTMFRVRVAGDVASDTRTLTLRVEVDTLLKVATAVLPPARVGVPYEESVRATGGQPPYRWDLVTGFVPSGLRLGDDGVVSGVPTQSAEAMFTVEVRSADGQVATAPLELTVQSLQESSPEGYDITVLAVAGISSELRSPVNSAVSRWERVVAGDLEDLTIPADAFSTNACGGFGNDLNGLEVEDIAVLVNIAPIDGPGRVLGRAGPCGVRENGLPFAGILTLDSDDLEPLVGTRTLVDLIFHEIGHIVGIGSLWDDFSLVRGAGESDPRYTGEAGVEQYRALGGRGPDIPVANTGGGGTRDVHWREDTFGDEIMTGYSESVGTAMPLSAMTIGSLVDFGYDVDLGEADPYSIPDPSAPEPVPPAAGAGRDLVIGGPLVMVYPDGSFRLIDSPERR